jgi:hypothetical protein
MAYKSTKKTYTFRNLSKNIFSLMIQNNDFLFSEIKFIAVEGYHVLI